MKLTTKTVLATMAMAAAILPVGKAFSAEGRTYVGGRFSLDIQGANAGLLQSFSGGGAVADIVLANVSQEARTAKQVVNTGYSDIQFQIGLDLGKLAASWIMDSFNNASPLGLDREGAILLLDMDGKARRRVDFTGALITEIKFPPFDVQQRDSGFLAVTVSPGTVDLNLKGDQKIVPPFSTKQKQWVPSNFRFQLGNLPCGRVVKIDNVKISRQLAEVGFGESREVQVSTLRPEYSNLTLSISAIDLEPWASWYQKFLVQGQNADEDELDGSIELLDRDLKKVLGTIELKGVGMKAFNPFPAEVSGSESVKRFTVELYVEQMKLDLNQL